MKSYRKELWFNAPTRRAFINITPQVNEALQESGIQEGLVLVNTEQFGSRKKDRCTLEWSQREHLA